MADSPVVSGLNAWVDEQREQLLQGSIFGSRTAKMLNIQTGVKYKAALNILSTSVTFGDGSTCGWSEAGTSTLTQRIITVGTLKVNMAFCDKALLKKWAGYKVAVAAGRESLPFEEYFMDGIRKNIAKELEVALWQGDTSSLTTNLSFFDGFIKLFTNDASVIDVTVSSGSYFACVQSTLAAIPPAVLEKDDVVIFCNPAFMNAYRQELINANLYHFEPGADLDDIVIPGSRVRLVAVGGLIGVSKLVAGSLENMYMGVDLEGDEEVFDTWHSKDAQEFRVNVCFNAGVQVAFPGEIVMTAYSSLSSPSANGVQLGEIATGTSSIATAVGKIAGCVNSSNQLETNDNSGGA